MGKTETAARLARVAVDCFVDLAAWQAWQKQHEVLLAARWLMAQQLRNAVNGPAFAGWCALCRTAVNYRISDSPQLAGVWYYRDDAVCSGCGMMGRLRMGVLLLQQLLGAGRPSIYVNEQISALYPWLLRHYADVQGSEYAPDPATHHVLQQRLDWLLRDQRPQRVVHEDATALSHPDGRFNALLSFDVLEHIPDYHAALREFARVLQPGGIAILTAPFLDNAQDTRIRARHLADGTLEHVLPPEYHGDPMVNGHQILCYQDFGWDILDALRSAGFRDAQTVSMWDLTGGFPSQLTAWVARR
jgi:SAM-dependent methyltransferase